VCSVTVNGLNLSEDQEDKFKDTAINEIKDFSIKTQSLKFLLDESIAQCSTFLGSLTLSIETAAQMYRAEDLAAAHRFYSTCIEGAQLFIEMLTHYKIAIRNSGVAYPAPWKTLEAVTERTLRQILEAYREKNYILVADLLEYELSPILVQWQGEFGSNESVYEPTQGSDC
jgi:hypothetical protein